MSNFQLDRIEEVLHAVPMPPTIHIYRACRTDCGTMIIGSQSRDARRLCVARQNSLNFRNRYTGIDESMLRSCVRIVNSWNTAVHDIDLACLGILLTEPEG